MKEKDVRKVKQSSGIENEMNCNRILIRNPNLLNQRCLGTQPLNPPILTLATPVARKPVGYCEPTTETSRRRNSLSRSPPNHQAVSHHRNGNEFSKEKPSTSTKSSRHSIMLSLMRREWVAWETRKSALELQKRRREYGHRENGPQLGRELPKPSPSLSLTDAKNYLNTEITSTQNSQLSYPHLTQELSSTTSPLGTKSQQVNTACLPIFTGSAGYTQLSSCQMGLKDTPINHLARNLQDPSLRLASLKSVTNSTPGHASGLMLTASTCTLAKIAENLATERRIARTTLNEDYGLQPKNLRHNMWEEGSSLSPTTAEWSETARPLVRPPLTELLNSVANRTVADNPSLFHVHTPVNIDVFEQLLTNHPNPKFVTSVCTGLREGFWPWADTLTGGFPETHDESRPMPTDDRKSSFIRDQCLKERHKGYYSESFGTELLPGMYSMPIHAVPKPHSDNLRLVTDHSAGPFSLNNMIDHSCVTGFPLDNMHHLGEMLLDTRRSIGNVPLTLWKSDIADAYRLLPVHPLWQAKQIVTVDGERYVD